MQLFVAALQLPAVWARPGEQLARAGALLEAGPAVDVALLPEACLTGYLSPAGECDLRRFAEPVGGEATERLSALARAHRVTLVAPLVELDAGRAYNAMLVLGPGGEVRARYRKRHPWFPEQWATPGAEPLPLLTVAGATMTLAVCFDVHFLEAESARELDAADVLLFPSAWVEERDSREAMLTALARAHGVAIVNANWGPGEPAIAGQGRSMIVSAQGTVLARAPARAREARLDATLELTPRLNPSA